MNREQLEAALQESEAKVSRLEKRLKEADRELEVLAYSISHDLRAPLRAIKGFSEALGEDYHDKLEGDGQRYLSIISTSTEQIVRLIDGVLIFSRLGRQEIRPSELKMKDMVQSLIAELTAKIPQRKLDFQLGVMPDAWGDLNLIRQVWSNLMENAIKFTRPRELGVIEISGKLEGAETVYSVKDNGVGFDMKYAEKLFGMFQRFHAEKEFEGAGVGLAVAQRLVRRHGGRIWADSTPDQGSTFFFALPAGKPSV
jgi:light-regulated signal transduction histidine kinase (bacteriophytochrome)